MKYSKDDIIEALERCSLNSGSGSCEDCPLKEECENSPFASVLAKYTLEMLNKIMHENRELTEQRDTFREYTYNMQKYVENVRHYEEAGYEPSAARYAAEMDMWRCVTAEKQMLHEEIERLSLMLTEKRDIKAVRSSVKEHKEQLPRTWLDELSLLG